MTGNDRGPGQVGFCAPSADLSQLRLYPAAMVIGDSDAAGLLVLFSGILVAIGTVMPTAKEAEAVFGPLMFSLFVPFYIVSLIVNDSGSLIMRVFTFFSLRVPATVMLRNGLGTLDPSAVVIVIVEVSVVGTLVLCLAVGLFRYAAMTYTDRLTPRRTANGAYFPGCRDGRGPRLRLLPASAGNHLYILATP